MINIRTGDIDAEGKNGGTQYIIEFMPSIKFEARILKLLSDEGKEEFMRLVDQNMSLFTPEKIKAMFLAEYDNCVETRKKSLERLGC